MSDVFVKAMGEDRPPWEFDELAFTQPPPLNEATVAIVSTASLHHEEQDDLRQRIRVTGYWIMASVIFKRGIGVQILMPSDLW